MLCAVGLLKPGGTLFYSTCTFTPEENEVQVAWLLQSHPCMELVEQASGYTPLVVLSQCSVVGQGCPVYRRVISIIICIIILIRQVWV